MMMTRASIESALAISTICRCAIDSSATGASGAKSAPRRSSSGRDLRVQPAIADQPQRRRR